MVIDDYKTKEKVMKMFQCEICRQNGVILEKRNLVPHIKKKHPEINGDTKKYMEMFPEAKLREAPSTSFANNTHRTKSINKSIESRTGKTLSSEHREKIGEANKNSEKHKLSRKILSKKYKTGELIHANKFFAPKEEIIDLYQNKNLTIKQIAKHYGVERHTISKLFTKFKIQRRELSESIRLSLNNNKETKSLSQMEKDVLNGLLLGDGCLDLDKGITPFYRHSSKYPEFLVWLKSLLPNVNWGGSIISIKHDKKSGNDYFGIHSKVHPDFIEIFNNFYKKIGNKQFKHIPPNININSTVLLHWFLGDGSYSDYLDKSGKLHRDLYLATFCFTEDDLYKYVVPQLNSMGILCKVKKTKNGPIVVIYAESYKRFFEAIGGQSPVPCYDYKFKIVNEKFQDIITPEWESISVPDSIQHYRSFGFPFIYVSPQNRLRIFNDLSKTDPNSILEDNILLNNKVGLKLANLYQNHRFNIKTNYSSRSAIDIFQNDELLEKILFDIVKKFGRIKNTEVRNRCALWSNCTPYNFKPLVAKFIYNKYSQSGETIMDPCSGFGGRLLGCISLQDRYYIGVEPEKSHINGLIRMAKDLKFSNYHLYRDAFEDFNYDLKKEISLIFTSPPYFNLEQYNEDNPKQSHVRYKTYDEWKNGFLATFIDKSYDLLKDGGHFCIAINNIQNYPVADDFKEMALKKFSLVQEYKIEYNKISFDQTEGSHKYEPLYVFKKSPDWRTKNLVSLF